MKIVIILTFAFATLATFTSMCYHDLQLYQQRYERSVKSNIELCAKIEALKLKNRQ